MMKVALTSLPLWPTHFPPLGLSYIYSAIESHHEVWSKDLNAEIWSELRATAGELWEENSFSHAKKQDYFLNTVLPVIRGPLQNFVKFVLKNKFDVVGFSVNECSYHATKHVMILLKKICPDLFIICGGPEIYEENPRVEEDIRNKLIDVAVIGEGEESIVAVLDALENKRDLSQIGGILFPQSKRLGKRVPKGQFIDFDRLKFPYFSNYNPAHYSTNQFPIMMSRGCVAACTFCTEFVTWRSFRIRQPLDVVAELEYQHQNYGANNFFFCDSLLNGRPDELELLVDLLIEKNLPISWSCFCRVDEKLNLQLLTKMKIAGCHTIRFGFESGSQKILNKMNKQIDISQSYRVAKDCYKAGINIHALMLFGYPGETEEDFYKTLDFIYSCSQYITTMSVGNSLEVPDQSPIGKRPTQFDIKVDLNQRPIGDDDSGEWMSVDGKNNYKFRMKRMHQLHCFLHWLSIDWDPKPEGYGSPFNFILGLFIYIKVILRGIQFGVGSKSLALEEQS